MGLKTGRIILNTHKCNRYIWGDLRHQSSSIWDSGVQNQSQTRHQSSSIQDSGVQNQSQTRHQSSSIQDSGVQNQSQTRHQSSSTPNNGIQNQPAWIHWRTFPKYKHWIPPITRPTLISFTPVTYSPNTQQLTLLLHLYEHKNWMHTLTDDSHFWGTTIGLFPNAS